MTPTPKAKSFKMMTARDFFRRWEIIKTSSNGRYGIVTEMIVRDGATTYTVHPYKIPKNKWVAMIKFMWLKIKVHYS